MFQTSTKGQDERTGGWDGQATAPLAMCAFRAADPLKAPSLGSGEVL